MRLILVILILSLETVLSRYYEKRRFDRSVYDDSEILIVDKRIPKKEWTFIDYETYFKAYKDKNENDCYLEQLRDIGNEELLENRLHRQKILYTSTEALTKLEAWRIAGGRIVDFCQGRNIILLQNTIPILEHALDPFSNVIPQDENDIASRRVADVVLTPLISRAKRQVILEEREKINESFRRTRTRRQTSHQPRGRFRGQTQSQYLSVGNNEQNEGKAEAEATEQSSRAVVSGSHGMGQAQSMSSSGVGCEDCPKFTTEGGAPDRYVQHPGITGTGTLPRTGGGVLPGTSTGGTHTFPKIFPTIEQTGGRIVDHGTTIPGTTMGTTYPNGVTPGGKVYPDTIAPGSRGIVPGTVTIKKSMTYPAGLIPGTTRYTIRNGVVYPVSVSGTSTGGGVIYPGSVPGSTTTGGGVIYPGRVPGSPAEGGVTYPGSTTTGGGVVYPGRAPGTPTGGGVIYPGSSTTGGGVTYPGSVAGSTITGGGAVYPSGVPGARVTGGEVAYPGNVPGTTTDGGVSYPSNVPGSTSTGGGAVYPSSLPDTTGGGIAYPGSGPGTTTTRGGIPYPGSVPGSTTTGGGAVYPGSTTIGGGVVYPGTTSTRGGAVYPGGVPGTTSTRGGAVYPGGVPDTTSTRGGAVYPGSVPDTTSTRGGAVYPGSVPDTTSTRGGAVYPGSVPGTTTTGGGVVYPGSVPGTTTTGGGVVYPGSVPGTTTTGGGVVYPGSVPGTQTLGSGVVYPGSVPGTPTQGVDTVYPGSVPTTTGGGVVYPGSVPSTSRVVYPSNVIGGTITRGGVVYPGSVPGTTTTGGGVIYPGSVPGTTTAGGGVVYPGSVPGTPTLGSGVVYPGNIPGSTVTGGDVYRGQIPGIATIGSGGIYSGSGSDELTSGKFGPYSGGISSDGRTRISYPESIVQSGSKEGDSKASADSKMYPGQIPGVLYPGMVVTGPSPSGIAGTTTTTGAERTISYPSGISRGHIPDSTTGGDITSRTPGIIPTGVGSYPGGIVTGTPGHLVTGDRISYTGGISTGTGGTGLYPGSALPGTKGPNIGPNVITTGLSPDAGTIISYPVGSDNANLQKIGSGQSGISYPNAVLHYPGGEKYPSSPSTVPSGYSTEQGQYPGTWHAGQGRTIPDMTEGHTAAGINRQGAGQYPSEGQNARQQYVGLQYPTGVGLTANTREASQYYQQATSDDNSDSQASSSVKQTDSGTQASASAQGTYGQGTAQSQITGTYSGSGSFSGQAGSSDINKSSQTEISGGKDGATSNSQGTGGYGKSLAQVQLDSESGATSTGAQSSGWNHGTNSQVQASSKGGMADAQANGEGSTSSQAQIGFQPYLKTDETLEKHSKPFRGGGTASAQSGTNRGQSQSQLEGSFQYGITYTGAAQAGSGSGAVASRKPFNFSRTDTELFNPFKPQNTLQIAKDNKSEVTNISSDTDYDYNQDNPSQGLQTSSSSRKTIITNATKDNSQNVANKQNQFTEKSQVEDTMYDYDEYDAEDYDTSQMPTSINSKQSKSYIIEQNNSDHQSQMIQVTTGNRYDVRVNQDSNTAQTGDMLQTGQSLPGYTIPPGFRGRVTSVAGDETTAHGDGKSQSQTVSLTPIDPNTTHQNKSPITEIRSLKTNHERLAEDQNKHQKHNFPRIQNQLTSVEYSKPTTKEPIKPSYYTVTNSFAGKMDGSRNSPRKYEHRYYTKSSTCGYFTFSCNVVYGSNGRTKICKPKMPTNPDGTPLKC